MHRLKRTLAATFFCAAVGGAAGTPDAAATFHFMQIEQVAGGVGGDVSAQAIQLRMRATFQNLVSQAQLWARDAQGNNPVLLIDFPANVPDGSSGARVLVAGAAFADVTDPAAQPDFILTNLIPQSYLAAGTVTFEDDFGNVFWRLCWGGDDYTGPTTGLITNDPDGEFGPPWPGPLPSEGAQALQFQGPFNAASSNNADDYALTDGPAVFVNNAGESFTVELPCPWDCQSDGADGAVGVSDFLTLLAQWGGAGTSCDFGAGDPGVGVSDFLDLLANWGPCP